MLVGVVTGDRITGSWWDVPKGAKRPVNKGTLDLQWSQSGARIVRKGGDDFGPDVFSAIDPDSVSRGRTCRPPGSSQTSTKAT